MICGPPPCTMTTRRPGVAQEDDVLRERLAQRLLGHGVTAVLDDDRAAVEAREPRQRLDERGRFRRRACQAARRRWEIGSGAHVLYAEFSWTYATDRSVVSTVAVAGPAFRSSTIETSGPERSTSSRDSPGALSRQTITPLMETSRVSGSNAACVVPAADSTRPQFGSLPNSAHLSRFERETAAADLDGLVLGGGVDDLDADPLGDALGVGDELLAEIGQHLHGRPRSSSSGWAGTPLAPLASSSTVSLVDMQPSLSIRSSVWRVGLAQRGVESRRVGHGIGREDAEHGREPGSEHAGTLDHPADGEPGIADGDGLLGDGVGGADRLGGVGAAVRRRVL